MVKKILIVDDSPTIIAFLSNLVRDSYENAEIETASDGREACKQAIRHMPDLILMDCEMPVMSGIEAVSKLKSNELTLDIPIILLSAADSPEDIKNAFEAGVIYFVKKPIDPSYLLTRIQSALNLSAQIKELKQQRNQLILSNHINDTILRSILPDPILKQIKQYGSIPPKCYRNTVVMFVDMVDFTSKSGKMSHGTLLRELQDTFKEFDNVIESESCTRIKTIGDAYMAVCGMFHQTDNVELRAVQAAVKIREAIIERNKTNQIKWEIKIGLYSGDVICSSVSTTNLSFDIFGETVNMAARMQASCEPMQINISESIQKKVSTNYHTIARSARKVKGKGTVPMYYIHKELNLKDSNKQKGVTTMSNPLIQMN
ncbi:adenylate/guanylate cyclase domain-containing protein [Carboxylicivirga linearis]|uniref:Response regulator n=1 Tax=Carboxylicivirga linearis TaxID=1628157 RepID=A0ABS5JQZ6_9BACT|nr:adenylate/guanylate cyclase domain-containing protein [Carboxylicivirga linearis]MBS2097223.1 response regulator [Carboxylicivirga linearis]